MLIAFAQVIFYISFNKCVFYILKGKGDRDRTVSENSEHEFDPQFKPIVTLPEIEIYTNEEEEDVMLKLRAKLFRFDTKSDDTPEWKVRSVIIALFRNKILNCLT